MADVLFSRPEQGAIGQNGKRLLGRLVDNGDGTFSPHVATTGGGGILAANGDLIYPEMWEQTRAYNSDGTLAFKQVTDPESGDLYAQTMTYTAGQLTGISRWQLKYEFDFTATTTLHPRIAFSRPTLGTRYNVAGSIVTEAANVPRFDYDPLTHAARGLLIEPQRTNLLPWSEDASKVPPWNRIGINASLLNDSMTVRGITLQKVTASSASFSLVEQTFGSVDAGATAQISVYAVAGTSPQTALRIETSGSSAHVLFNWAGGVPSPTSVVQSGIFSAGVASVADLGGGLYRLALRATNTSGAIVSAVRAKYYTNWSPGAVGDSVYYGGFQAEINSPATSYIPTTTAQVTRAADIAQVTLPQPSDVLVQDRNGGAWITAVPAGPYTLTPRTDQRHITRWRTFPAGFAANNAAMAVAY